MSVRIRFERRETSEVFSSTTQIIMVETWYLLGIVPIFKREKPL